MSPAGRGTKNDCADEGQQQFALPLPYPEGKRPLGSLSRKWEVNIQLDGVVWTGLI
jgi:hypothetical protein